jgi:hypothetical protein
MSTGIPRGWTFNTQVNGGTTVPQIVLAGLVGISHVLTDVDCEVWSGATASAASIQVISQIGSGSGVNYVFGNIVFSNATAYTQGILSWDGSLIFPVGSNVVIQTSAQNASLSQYLQIQGYDI